VVRIPIREQAFYVYRDFLDWHCPIFLSTFFQGTRNTTPEILEDMDYNIFSLFVQWLYTESLLNKRGEPAYQHRLIGLWVFGKILQMPKMQNDAIELLEARRTKHDGNTIQTRAFGFVYKHTAVDDGLRRYLVDVCASMMDALASEVKKGDFPKEMLQEIQDAKLVELEDGKGEPDLETGAGLDITKYFVPEAAQEDEAAQITAMDIDAT